MDEAPLQITLPNGQQTSLDKYIGGNFLLKNLQKNLPQIGDKGRQKDCSSATEESEDRVLNMPGLIINDSHLQVK